MIIAIVPDVVDFAQDKDRARAVRQDHLLPALERGEQVVLDFKAVGFATQSFIHALIGEALQRFPQDALQRIEFRNCAQQVRDVVQLVADYSLGGFEPPADVRRHDKRASRVRSGAAARAGRSSR
jgi:hypothetical protein